ncbi:Sodium/hydrogen exchanger family-domain-containing protein [Cokeromyces recurvatus]|uniref:Sodium/hydrogen exchanger family-domain-containing protein n=1 Tax=Cokeromyces recurvatus TaxID=90255 RepID=UPI00222109C7|nr:Sodium/hydrogen exchanger family-domain-containing protein [Cokeromyces recurvatus]KAI7906455.1 Sodium/hydrogen exchanger family-domain-containing protein [Cokeromyces recurvatus]
MLETVSIVAAVLGGFILLYGLCSLVIKEKLYLSEASIAIVCGILFGPICAKFIDIRKWGDEDVITHEFCRFVIAIQVMAVGVALPKAYLKKQLTSILIMLGPVMIYMWLVSGLLVWAFIPGLNFLEALMIAACFTPTDPVLANSIVQGKFAEKHVPSHLRNIIVCESGANDGLGYPFLFLAIYLLQMNVGSAIGKWAYWTMAYNILLSIIIGFVAGYIARKLLKYAEQKKCIDKESFLVFAIALALFLIGIVGLIGSDDILACFIAGNSFTWDDWFRIETEKAYLMEPWSTFSNPALEITVWRLIVLAILVLILRRLPIVIALYKFIPAIRTWREAIFSGWFGPIGVGAIFYYTVAIEAIPEDGPNSHARSVLKPIIYFMVLASVIVHGITIPLFYIGTYATRTLTRTSDHGNQILHFPAIQMLANRKNSPHMDESVIANMKINENILEEKTIATSNENNTFTIQPKKKHTAITIIAPTQIPERVKQSNSRYNLYYNNNSNRDLNAQSQTASSLRNNIVLDNIQDETLYLPEDD